MLDSEQRALIRDVVRRAGVHPASAVSHRLAGAIANSMRQYWEEQSRTATRRRSHDALRQLYYLADADCPAIGLIRALIQKLPGPAMDALSDRATNAWTRVFPEEVFPENLRTWAKKAPKEKLLELIRSFAAAGGAVVPGRSRGGGQRSRSRLEPLILGTVRGAQTPSITEGALSKTSSQHRKTPLRGNGRPQAKALDDLVMLLACDWLHATGRMPEHGRSDHTPFGALVHHVFAWLGLDKRNQASQALRRYWAEVDSAVTIRTEIGIEWR